MEDQVTPATKPLQHSLLIPLLLVLVLLVSGFGLALREHHRQQLERTTIERGELFTQLLRRLVDERLAALVDALEDITADSPELKGHLHRGDREYLLRTYMPLFQALQDKLDVSHFYFHRADGRNLARLHSPDRFGDLIDRQTLRAAQAGSAVSVGVELGPLGDMALRAVRRLETDAGAPVGFVELGTELGALLAVLKQDYGADFVVVTFKKELKRESWEVGSATIERQVAWDLFRNVVVSYQSTAGLAARVRDVIEPRGGRGEHDAGRRFAHLILDDRELIALTYPLADITGKQRGEVIALRDVTAAAADMRRVSLAAFAFAGLLSAVLVSFLYVALRRVDRRMQAQQEDVLRGRERLNLAMSVANDGVWDWDLENDHLSLDNRCYTMLGYEVGGFPAAYDVWTEMVHPEDLPELEAAIKRYWNDQQEDFDAEFRFRRADGEYCWLRSRGKMVAWDAQGIPTRFVGTNSNISARKEAEIEKERAAATLSKRNRTLESLNRLGRDLTLANSIEEIGKLTVSVLREQDGAPLVGIFLLDETGSYLDLSYYDSIRVGAELFRAASRVPLVGSFNGLALQKGEILHCADFENDDRIHPDVQKAFVKVGACAETILPLVSRGHALGTIAIVYLEREEYTAEDRWAHNAVAQAVAIAIENLRNIEELAFQARHDSLTGLPNRLALHEYVKEVIASAGDDLSMVMFLLDLNRFKEVNDTLGHHIGDELLRALADRLGPSIDAQGGRLYRLGGDEFAAVVLQPGEAAATVAGSMVAEVQRPVSIRGLNLEQDCSIGAAIYPEHGTDSHELLRCSDIAMYQAKADLEAFRLYEVDIDDKNPRRLEMLSEFRRALETGQLALHFQPRVTLGSYDVHCCEALLRWEIEDQKFIPPKDFIPLVETTDLVHSMTLWVVRQALEQVRDWSLDGLQISVSVNVSGRNLIDTEFPEKIKGLLEEVGVSGERLQVEITETALVTDPERALEILQALADLGVSIAIDDFGTGYSSLSYLKQLPLNALKVDASFVKDMLRSSQDAVIVQSTISLANSLGLRVIAEGVEESGVALRLEELNCDEAQGYFFSRPLPADALENWARKRSSAGEQQQPASDQPAVEKSK